MLYTLKLFIFWLKYNDLGIVWKTTKLIDGGHRGFQAYRPICYYFYVLTFFYVFQNPKVVIFYVFFAVSYTFSWTDLFDILQYSHLLFAHDIWCVYRSL